MSINNDVGKLWGILVFIVLVIIWIIYSPLTFMIFVVIALIVCIIYLWLKEEVAFKKKKEESRNLYNKNKSIEKSVDYHKIQMDFENEKSTFKEMYNTNEEVKTIVDDFVKKIEKIPDQEKTFQHLYNGFKKRGYDHNRRMIAYIFKYGKEQIDLEKKKEEVKSLYDTNEEVKGLINGYILQYGEGNPELGEKLALLLEKRGYAYDKYVIFSIYDHAMNEIQYQKIKEKFLKSNQDSFYRFLDDYVSHYGEKTIEDIHHLKRLANEEEDIEVSKREIRSKINEILKNKELEEFERNLLGDVKKLSMLEIDSMSGYEFESFLKKLLQKRGYQVVHTKLSKDQGADLIIKKFGVKTAVQAKRSSSTIGNRAVREALAAKINYKCQKSMVVTTSNKFSKEAIELARKSNTKLIGRIKLKEWIEKYWW